MSESFLNGRITLHAGDMLNVLPTLPENSIDAVVTDPPYGLNFMGKAWDHGVPSALMWGEVFRVLKPGGHLLAFAGTRTQHRMACAIEDAGFEIRDMIAWLYGSGFPKSHDVAKAIDRVGGMSPRGQSELLRARRETAGLTREQVAAAVGCTPGSVRDWEDGRARAVGASTEWIVPSDQYRARLADLLGYSADERRLIASAVRRRGDGTVFGLGHTGDLMSGGNSAASVLWQGWGTALKPALEPITFARKPLVGTVAENVLTHGTGALNIDACRILGRERTDYGLASAVRSRGATYGAPSANADFDSSKGRWPANVLLDGSDEVAGAFPESKDGVATNRNRGEVTASAIGFTSGHSGKDEGYGGGGSAARFFYNAKADSDDRIGSKHPTVKPVDLMRWCCRLVTPPGGIVLDPFAGTGTTGEAAFYEGFSAILVEREAEYRTDIARRMKLAMAGPDERRRAIVKAKAKPDNLTGTLFAPAAPMAAE